MVSWTQLAMHYLLKSSAHWGTLRSWLLQSITIGPGHSQCSGKTPSVLQFHQNCSAYFLPVPVQLCELAFRQRTYPAYPIHIYVDVRVKWGDTQSPLLHVSSSSLPYVSHDMSAAACLLPSLAFKLYYVQCASLPTDCAQEYSFELLVTVQAMQCSLSIW